MWVTRDKKIWQVTSGMIRLHVIEKLNDRQKQTKSKEEVNDVRLIWFI